MRISVAPIGEPRGANASRFTTEDKLGIDLADSSCLIVDDLNDEVGKINPIVGLMHHPCGLSVRIFRHQGGESLAIRDLGPPLVRYHHKVERAVCWPWPCFAVWTERLTTLSRQGCGLGD
jgi:hypothetical protein